MPHVHAIRRVGSVFLAETAVVVGDVELGPDCSVWHHCVVRGDVAPIRVGARVNIQDGAVLHCNQGVSLEIAEDVSVGHHAVVHCRKVGPGTLVGMRATVLDDCEIGQDCLIAAGAVVPPGTVVPDGMVVMGVPGRVVRPVSDRERDYLRRVVETYVELARRHADGAFPPYDG